jgi:hypothetical protein|tara:strand:+ start:184 stop:501 length:318 start_codon:yes stop_codon:yes gene_type:complete
MALKGRSPSGKEIEHMDRVSRLGCIVCRNEGFFNPAEIHHVDGKTKKNCHFKVLPLCYEHHRKGSDKEPISRHPYKKRFEKAYGTEESLLRQIEELLGTSYLQLQ